MGKFSPIGQGDFFAEQRLSELLGEFSPIGLGDFFAEQRLSELLGEFSPIGQGDSILLKQTIYTSILMTFLP